MLFGGSAAAGLAAKGPGACQGLLRGIFSLLGGLSCFLIFWFWMGLIWFVVHQQYCNLYLGTVQYVLASQGDAEGRYMALFNAMLPCAIVCVPAISCGCVVPCGCISSQWSLQRALSL